MFVAAAAAAIPLIMAMMTPETAVTLVTVKTVEPNATVGRYAAVAYLAVLVAVTIVLEAEVAAKLLAIKEVAESQVSPVHLSLVRAPVTEYVVADAD